jgi:protein-L-isoaspartate(D-aspartate) O-methyltransferase
MSEIAEFDNRKIRLIIHLRQAGITNTEVLSAIERTPRDLFVPPHFETHAYEDQAVPIGLGQTISQPYIVAMMTDALEVEKTQSVLEIGTGSGYQAAVLSRLCRRVYTIERHRPLLELAEHRFNDLKLRNITSLAADGMKGWPNVAGNENSFDRIIVTASVDGEPPVALMAQLKIGGIMVIPVGGQGQNQTLRKYKKESEDVYAVQNLLPVRFVPLLPDVPRNNSYSSAELEELSA